MGLSKIHQWEKRNKSKDLYDQSAAFQTCMVPIIYGE